MRVRLYVPEAENNKEVAISKEQVRHLKVLRVKEGDKIGIFDGKGHEFEATYSGKVSDKLLLERPIRLREEPRVKITLAIAVPKGARMDVLVEKVSEIGVSNIVPIICSRSVVEPREAKVERWRKIAIEACSQCERSIVPTISEPIKFAELLSTIKQYNHVFVCHMTGTPLTKEHCECPSIMLIVGPEGDFTPAELDAAKEAGCTMVSLGPTILRTETAGIVAIGQIVGLSQKAYK
ncbi:RNA methyltransferase [uncultured archaeon]|nr:RNA methyltransferase [uncultured archaeon]